MLILGVPVREIVCMGGGLRTLLAGGAGVGGALGMKPGGRALTLWVDPAGSASVPMDWKRPI